MALGAWAGFGFGAARGAALGIGQSLSSHGATELAGVLMRAEQLVVAAGVPSDALEADVLSRVIDPFLEKLHEREAALASADLAERLPLVVERVALEAAPVRHAGMPLIIGWAALLLMAHGVALWRSGVRDTTTASRSA